MLEAESRRRRALLVAALGFARLDTRTRAVPPGVAALRVWLDTWAGIGRITAGMARHGYDVSLTRYDEQGWRATFYVTGREHSPTGAVGSAWEPTPFAAVQAAALETLLRAPDG